MRTKSRLALDQLFLSFNLLSDFAFISKIFFREAGFIIKDFYSDYARLILDKLK